MVAHTLCVWGVRWMRKGGCLCSCCFRSSLVVACGGWMPSWSRQDPALRQGHTPVVVRGVVLLVGPGHVPDLVHAACALALWQSMPTIVITVAHPPPTPHPCPAQHVHGRHYGHPPGGDADGGALAVAAPRGGVGERRWVGAAERWLLVPPTQCLPPGGAPVLQLAPLLPISQPPHIPDTTSFASTHCGNQPCAAAPCAPHAPERSRGCTGAPITPCANASTQAWRERACH